MKRWIALHGTPQKEKSLFSQLKGTGSFGEKVARRLEVEYQMGDLYLDQEPELESSDDSLPYMHNVSRVAVGSSARDTVPIKMVSM
ncbi:hypothetical protein AB4Z32_27570, partial [Massilia sp. 2TAF26]|uniref:hypothetical protein n=1 Tax=Massilia sp. 2TAF26 TaxID=3233012 RepID=UPI003F9D79E2